MLGNLLYLLGALALGVLLLAVLRLRKRSHDAHVQELADQNVCPHLRPALQWLLDHGHAVLRAGQKGPELPLEIHIAPPFDPQRLYDDLNLQEPVFLSPRNVLYCKEDWCELHPIG